MSFLLRLCALPLICVALAMPAAATERDAHFDALMDALQITETIEIMREEGQFYGADIATQMMPDMDPEAWAREVGRIYDAGKMTEVIRGNMAAELEKTDLAPLLEFYQSETGREIVALELSARRAFLDPDLEGMAKERFAEMEGQRVRLLEQIATLIADSDLVEMNVAGALNSDFMFYRGLVDGGAYEMSEEDILADVWAQEDDLRQTSRDWLEPFLMVAYQPLDPDALEAYVVFWRTAEGRDLNRALFAGFDQMYEEISYLLGLAVAQEMRSEEL